MKKLVTGFSLFEFVVSMMISSILLTASLTIYHQISKGALRVQRITTNDTKIMIATNRLSTDLSGISPLWFTTEHYEKIKNLKKSSPTMPIKDQTPSSDPLPATKQKIEKNNFLFSQNADQNFNILTFVTSNAMQMYGNNDQHFVRVVYKLIPTQNNEKLFKLMRKQTSNPTSSFNVEELKSGSFYELASNITKINIEYGFIDQPKAEREKQPEKKLILGWANSWGASDDMKQTSDYRPILPEIVKLKISFLQDNDRPEISYEAFIPICVSQDASLQSFAEKRYYTQRNKPQPTAQN